MTESALNREQCREIDRVAVQEFGIPSIVLMENAGRGCVDVLELLGIDGPVVILCGKGNNAGDGFVVARHLDIRGYECRVLLLCPLSELRGDAATNFAVLQKTGAPIFEVGAASRAAPSATPLSKPGPPRLGGPTAELDEHARDAAWIVDAMLGTGTVGEPRPPFDVAIDWMNAHSAKKLAVDVPSGLDCDTGLPAARTIRADYTCTFSAMKIGFTQPAAKLLTGAVHVCDIGVPLRLIDEIVNE